MSIPTRLSEFDKLIVWSINQLGAKMAELDDKLNQLKASFEAALTRAQTDLETLKAKIDDMGHLSPEVASLIDGMIARAEAFDVNNPPPPDTGAGGAPAAAP